MLSKRGRNMSWYSKEIRKYKEEQEEQKKRDEWSIFNGRVFYDVFIIAISRVWKDRTLRMKKDPEDFVEAVTKEMSNLFSNPGDYAAIRMEETGIEVEVV